MLEKIEKIKNEAIISILKNDSIAELEN